MSVAEVDIDRIVDYAAEYGRVVKKIKKAGDNLVGLCPFHNDTNSSFTVNTKTGQYDCFACGASGNYISFVARINGISTKEAYKKILREHGVEPPQEQSRPQNRGSDSDQLKDYTLSEYSFSKRLPEDWLKANFHLTTDKDSKGVRFLKIPYLQEDGSESTFRKRYGAKQFRWKYGSSGKICLYNEHRLPDMRRAGYALMVEGESDTQTLSYLDFPALGVAGASLFKAEQTSKLQDLKLYLHIEPDMGGQTFLKKMKQGLKKGEFIGEVYTWSCGQFGEKDPSDLYIKYSKEEAQQKIRAALERAERIDIYEEEIPAAIDDAPVTLRQPEKFEFSDKGIYKFIKTPEGAEVPVNVCRTPIIITKRLLSVETGEEKIEIAFKRDGRWNTAIFQRSTLFQSKSITQLADLGCTITSENAKAMVQFLGALEAENIDIIEKAESTRSFGWQPGNRFLPGHASDIVLDIDPSQRPLASAYATAGTLEGWVTTMAPHRARYRFRFILASAFAAPLLRILKQRIFFVYNWGNSRGGKSAGLKAALSAWGDADRLMVNFNATQVALERMAAFYCDLPLGIDERQLAGNNQGGLEKIVYMIASGVGRARGAKGGGLQQTSVWRTVALTTGEEPLSTDTSQTGVSTRVIEIYGGPFEDEKTAGEMHQAVADNYGFAGVEFIRHLLELDEESIRQRYEAVLKRLREKHEGRNGSHIANVATVVLADILIDEWFFGGNNSEQAAYQMADRILIEQAVAEASGDVNENAKQFLFDWVMSNKNNFGANSIGQCYGAIVNDKAFIYPSVLNNALSKAGYSPRKTLKYMADSGYLGVSNDKNHDRISVVKRINGQLCRVVEFRLDMMEGERQPDPEPDDGWRTASEDEVPDFGDGQMELPYTD